MNKTTNTKVTKMPEREFRDLVRRMREAQREFFKTRSHLYLERAKALEKEIDRDLQADAPADPKNPTLFG